MQQVKRCGAIYPHEMHACTGPFAFEPLICNIPLDRHDRDSSGALRNHFARNRFMVMVKWDRSFPQMWAEGGNYRTKEET